MTAASIPASLVIILAVNHLVLTLALSNTSRIGNVLTCDVTTTGVTLPLMTSSIWDERGTMLALCPLGPVRHWVRTMCDIEHAHVSPVHSSLVHPQ